MKLALVTGASEGIGRALAVQLAQDGFKVVAVARNEVRLKELVAELGGAHEYLVADLSQAMGVAQVCARLSGQTFDLVVNNAGFGVYGPFAEANPVELQNMMQVNCTAVLDISQAYLKNAPAGGALINVSSTASRLPMPMASTYAASKAFVTGLSESLWYEARKQNIYVMALCPGMTRTKFHSRAGGDDRQIPDWFSQTPEQVARRACQALRLRKSPIVLCGPQRLLIFFSRFIPRKWVILLSGRTLEWGLARNRTV